MRIYKKEVIERPEDTRKKEVRKELICDPLWFVHLVCKFWLSSFWYETSLHTVVAFGVFRPSFFFAFALALVCVVPVSSKTSFFFAVSSSVGAIDNRLRKEPDVCSKPTNNFAV